MENGSMENCSSCSSRGRRLVLEIKAVSCKDLKAFNFFQKLTVYALVSLVSNDPERKVEPQTSRTPTDREGDGNPEWNHEMRFEFELENCDGLLIHLDLRHQGLGVLGIGDKSIGEVRVPLKDLSIVAVPSTTFSSPSSIRYVNYEVRNSDGKANGILNLSYKLNLNCCTTSTDPAVAVPPPPPPLVDADHDHQQRINQYPTLALEDDHMQLHYSQSPQQLHHSQTSQLEHFQHPSEHSSSTLPPQYHHQHHHRPEGDFHHHNYYADVSVAHHTYFPPPPGPPPPPPPPPPMADHIHGGNSYHHNPFLPPPPPPGMAHPPWPSPYPYHILTMYDYDDGPWSWTTAGHMDMEGNSQGISIAWNLEAIDVPNGQWAMAPCIINLFLPNYRWKVAFNPILRIGQMQTAL